MAEADPAWLDVAARALVHLKGLADDNASEAWAADLWKAFVAEEEVGPQEVQPLRRPRARQEGLGREVSCQEAAAPSDEKVGRQPATPPEPEEYDPHGSYTQKEEGDQWRALKKELAAATDAFADARARLEAVHARILDLAEQGGEVPEENAAVMDTVAFQGAGLRGCTEAASKVRRQQAARREAEAARRRKEEAAARAMEDARRRRQLLEEEAARRKQQRQAYLQREQERLAREERQEQERLAWAKKQEVFAELAEAKRRLREEHRVANPQTPRCFVCGLEGVKKSRQCPRLHEHWQYKE